MSTPKRPSSRTPKSTRTTRTRTTRAKKTSAADGVEDAELVETPAKAPSDAPAIDLPEGDDTVPGVAETDLERRDDDTLPQPTESPEPEGTKAEPAPADTSADPAGDEAMTGAPATTTAHTPGDTTAADTLPGDDADRFDLAEDASLTASDDPAGDGAAIAAVTASATTDDTVAGEITADARAGTTDDADIVDDGRAERDTVSAVEATPPPVTPWGGAPADISARSTADPASPAYVPPPRSETVEAAPPPPRTDEDYVEEGGSVAGRILFWLFLLFAGAGLILWAGPKIAPNLPSGLAPVAEWLTPGQRAARMELAALEERLEARIAELDTGLTPGGVTEQIDAAILESEGRMSNSVTVLAEDVNALSDQVAASDSTPIEERLATVETRIEGLVAELSSLRSDLTGLATGDGGITGQNAQEIDAFTAALAGVQAELDTLAARNGAMDQRIDEVAATAERQLRTAREEIEAAEAAAEAEVARASEQADMIALQNALETGAAFAEPLAGLAEQVEIPDPLPALATTGVPTQAELEQSFPDLAHEAIRAELAPSEGDGFLAGATSFLRARTAGRSLVEREGEDADAVLSRVEARLRRGDLDAAVAEAEQLSDTASARMRDWIGDLTARADALTAYRTLADRLDTAN